MDTGSIFLEALPLLIPIVGILTGPLVMYIWFRYSARKNEEVQKTIRALIDRRMDNMMDMVGFASFFLLIGLARLALWRWMPERKADSASSTDPAPRA
jgi:hypothetical protein